MKFLKWYDENNMYCSNDECYRPDPDDIIYFSAPDNFEFSNINMEEFFIENNLEYKNLGSGKYPTYEYKAINHKRWANATTLHNVLQNYDYKKFYYNILLNWLDKKYQLVEIEIKSL